MPGFSPDLPFFIPVPALRAIALGIGQEYGVTEGYPAPATPNFWEIFRMDLETTALILGVVLPLYPSLFLVYEKIGKYEVICAEFAALRKEHEKMKETKSWNRN